MSSYLNHHRFPISTVKGFASAGKQSSTASGMLKLLFNHATCSRVMLEEGKQKQILIPSLHILLLHSPIPTDNFFYRNFNLNFSFVVYDGAMLALSMPGGRRPRWGLGMNGNVTIWCRSETGGHLWVIIICRRHSAPLCLCQLSEAKGVDGSRIPNWVINAFDN